MEIQIFKKSQKKSMPGTTVIGLSARVIGHIVSDNAVLLDGGIEGNITAPEAFINGLVTGNIIATKQVVIADNAKIQGDVLYESVLVHPGANISGRLIHKKSKQLNSENPLSNLDS